jgi:hypothetical protein
MSDDEVIDAPPEAKAAETPEKRKYRAACRPKGEERQRTLTFIGAGGWFRSFWCADLRKLSCEGHEGYGRNSQGGRDPVLKLWLWGDQGVIIEGDNLLDLYNDLLEDRIAWLAEIRPEDEPPGEGATIIRKFYFRNWW